MTIHFEDLWEKSENVHKGTDQDQQSIINEISMKLSLYLIIDEKDIPKEDKESLKKLAFGEILFSLTNLSLRDNINVYEVLQNTLKNK